MPADPTAFFDTGWHRPSQACAPPWRAMQELATASSAWDERITATRSALSASARVRPDDVEERVAASVVHLGICARIIAPVLATAVRDGRVVDSTLQEMWWQPTLGGAFPLSLPQPSGDGLPLVELADLLRAGLVEDTMSTLADAVRRYSVSALIAWGNVASALHSAASMLHAAHPGRADDLRALVARLSQYPRLSAAGDAGAAPGTFRRNSCCLIYRVAGGRPTAVCGDCVLATTGHHTSPSRQSQVSSASRSSGTSAGST